MTKRIGILTSGGDCAGLNATIRAGALRAHHGYGWTPVRIRYGPLGLLERPGEPRTLRPGRRGGADAGRVAIAAGSDGGADVVLIPEGAGGLGGVVEHIARLGAAGRSSARVVVAEAARHPVDALDPPQHGIGDWLAHRLSQETGAEARATVLGHVQRGAMPTAEDRLLASALGVRAVDLLADRKADRMVAWWNRSVIDVPLEKVVGRSRTVDRDGALIRTARALGICLGDAA